MLLGEYKDAQRIYHDTRVRNPGRAGDLPSAVAQIEALVPVLNIPGDDAQALLRALGKK